MASNELASDGQRNGGFVRNRMGRRRSSVLSWKSMATSTGIAINPRNYGSADHAMFDQLESPNSSQRIPVGSAGSEVCSLLELNNESATRLSPLLLGHDLHYMQQDAQQIALNCGTGGSPMKSQSLQSAMATSPYTMHMLSLENVYTRDFLCCGRTWDSYHDLLHHHEECHGADFEGMDSDKDFEPRSVDSETHNHPSAGVMLGFPQSSVSSHSTGFLPSPPNSRASSPTRKIGSWNATDSKEDSKMHSCLENHQNSAGNHHYDGWVSQQMQESASTESEDCEMGSGQVDSTIKLFRGRNAQSWMTSSAFQKVPVSSPAAPQMLTTQHISQMASFASAAFQAANKTPLQFGNPPNGMVAAFLGSNASSHTETSEDDSESSTKMGNSSLANFVGISLSPGNYGNTFFPSAKGNQARRPKSNKKPGHRPTPKLKHHRQAPNTSMLTNNSRSGVISTPTHDSHSGASLSSDSETGGSPAGYVLGGDLSAAGSQAVHSKALSNITDRSILYPAGGRFRCPFERCQERRFPNAVEWRHHIRNYHQHDLPANDFEELFDRAHECLAPGCGRRYKNTSGFKYHMLSTHGVDYEC